MLKKLLLVLILFTIYTPSFAQEETELNKEEAERRIAIAFPQARMFDIDYGQSFSRDFESQLYREDFQKGEILNQRLLKILANIPVYRNQRLTITASGNYEFHQFEFNNLENVSNTSTFQQNDITTFHNMAATLSATYFSTLFKKPFIYNASIIVDGNDHGLERVKGFLGGSIILKRTANTTMTVGLIVFVDPTAQIPFAPTFSFNHKFKNSKWEFDMILPQRLIFRRPISSKSRISIGTTFGGSGFYVNTNVPNFPDVSEYSQLELRTGLIYEHLLTRNLVLTARGGMLNLISNKMTEKGENSKDYVYSNDQDMTGYFNIGFSFSPFLKKPNKQ